MSLVKEANMSRTESQKGLVAASKSLQRRIETPGGTSNKKLQRLAKGVQKNIKDPDHPGKTASLVKSAYAEFDKEALLAHMSKSPVMNMLHGSKGQRGQSYLNAIASRSQSAKKKLDKLPQGSNKGTRITAKLDKLKGQEKGVLKHYFGMQNAKKVKGDTQFSFA